VLSTGFVVVHDPGRGGEEDKAELTGWEELGDPIFNVLEFDVVPWSANERPSDRAKRGARGGALALEHTTFPPTHEITPALFSLPFSWTTILPARWSSISSNSSM